VAVIDIGSNSTRLLVADVDGGRVSPIERRSTVTRLGRGVDLSGRLAAEAIEAACGAVDPYVATLQELGAERVDAIATSAVRDADNGAAFVAELRERFDLSARVLDGEEEARLTYIGATSEVAPTVPTLIVDIGGGSTELIVGHGREIDWHCSLQAGVVRQTERHLDDDPPTPEQMDALATDVRAILADHVPAEIRTSVKRGIAVAGTATSLAAIAQKLDPYDPDRVHGYLLSAAQCDEILGRLSKMTVEERRHVPGLHPGRAPTIVAGAIIFRQVLTLFGLDRIEISEHDILRGAALELVF